jgi:hypothetical protein
VASSRHRDRANLVLASVLPGWFYPCKLARLASRWSGFLLPSFSSNAAGGEPAAKFRRISGGAGRGPKTDFAIPLFLPVILHMGLTGMLGVLSRVERMASSCVGMMCGFLVVSAIVVLGRFAMMMGSVSMMFRGLPMVLGCFF